MIPCGVCATKFEELQDEVTELREKIYLMGKYMYDEVSPRDYMTQREIDIANAEDDAWLASLEESAVVANCTRNAGPDTSVASSNLVSSAEIGPVASKLAGTNSLHHEDMQLYATQSHSI